LALLYLTWPNCFWVLKNHSHLNLTGVRDPHSQPASYTSFWVFTKLAEIKAPFKCTNAQISHLS
jgi:hypothetical protein